jgi:ribosome biogenesis GTPase A
VSIEWYPGHMATARKEAAVTMRKTDVVLEVLDARVPYSSHNPMIEVLRKERQRPALKILNKADVADPERTKQWLDHYNSQPGVRAIALSAKHAPAVKSIPQRALALAPQRNTPLTPLRLMILGIPNVGKSTLMNTLLGRKATKVGNEPAVTKSQLGHELGKNMWLIDTPGMLWPGLGEQTGLKLAATHSIGQNAYEQINVAADLASYLLAQYPELILGRFPAVASAANGREIVIAIARSRSLLLRGGAPDEERAARTLLGEFREGTLGRITLETPADIADREREHEPESEDVAAPERGDEPEPEPDDAADPEPDDAADRERDDEPE